MKGKFYLLIAAAGLAMIVVSAVLKGPTLFIWNITASIPKGGYFVLPGAPKRGDVVALFLPPEIAVFANERRYLSADAPALKVIAALDGDEICRKGLVISVNGIFTAKALKIDSLGRDMPSWSGCRKLGKGEVFLLAPHPSSFDGRYFGVIDQGWLIGRAFKL